MRQVLVDMHRLKHNPYNGLYTFSRNLGESLIRCNEPAMHLNFYVPGTAFGIFGPSQTYVMHRSIDKFYKTGTSQYDLWHITTQLSWYRPFNRRTKVVYTIHDFSYLIEDAGNRKRNKRLLKETQEKVNRADYVTAISEFALNQARENLNMQNIPSSVIYNGCNVLEYPGFDSPVYRPRSPFLFSIGLVQARKNFHVLPALLQDNEMELIIAGLNEFGYDKQIMEAAEKIGVGNRVKLLGAVSEQDKYWFYKNCLAFVFPSYAEGFGLPVLEAMYHGKPVFLSDKTSLPEVGGNLAGYFRDFDPEHMRDVFKNGMADYSLPGRPEAIKKHALSFSWDKSAREYIDVYNNLL